MLFKPNILTVALLATSLNLCGHDSDKSWYQTLRHSITKPSTLFITSIAGLGIYSLYNPSKSIEAFQWVQKSLNALPALVTYASLTFGGWFMYYTWRKKQNKIPARRPLDDSELKHYIDGHSLRIENIENILDIRYFRPENAHKKDDKEIKINLIDILRYTLGELHGKIENYQAQQDLLVKQLEEFEETFGITHSNESYYNLDEAGAHDDDTNSGTIIIKD